MLNKFKKQLRHSQTDVENILWQHLRNRNLSGFKFRRQHILQGYIVDFVCLEKKLVIELDGSQHIEQEEKDNLRTKKLKDDGFNVIRFWNHEITENLEDVLEIIHEILNTPSPAASRRPLPQGER